MKKLVFCVTLGIVSVIRLGAGELAADYHGAIEVTKSPARTQRNSIASIKPLQRSPETELKVAKSSPSKLPGSLEIDSADSTPRKVIKVDVLKDDHSGIIRSVDMDFSTGKEKPMVIASSRDGRVRLWSGTTPAILQENGKDDGNHGDSLAITTRGKDGKTVIISTATESIVDGEFQPQKTVKNKNIKVRDASGKLLCTLPGQQGVSISSLAVQHDHEGNQLLATGSHDAMVRIADLTTCKPKFKLKGHQAAITSLDMLDDKEATLLVSADGAKNSPAIRVWNAATGKHLTTMKSESPVLAVSLGRSLKGEPIVVAGAVDGSVTVYNAKNGQKLDTFNDATAVTSVKIAQDTENRPVIISVATDALKGNSIVRVRDGETGKLKNVIHYPKGHMVNALQVKQDLHGKSWIASGTGTEQADGELFVYPFPQPTGEEDIYIQALKPAGKTSKSCC